MKAQREIKRSRKDIIRYYELVGEIKECSDEAKRAVKETEFKRLARRLRYPE
jgi:hypothetical protein